MEECILQLLLILGWNIREILQLLENKTYVLILLDPKMIFCLLGNTIVVDIMKSLLWLSDFRQYDFCNDYPCPRWENLSCPSYSSVSMHFYSYHPFYLPLWYTFIWQWYLCCNLSNDFPRQLGICHYFILLDDFHIIFSFHFNALLNISSGVQKYYKF